MSGWDAVLKQLDMDRCESLDTPICRCVKLSNNLNPISEKDMLLTRDKPYAWIVGEA